VIGLELREKELFSQFHNLPNGHERKTIYRKWKKVYDSITASEIIRAKGIKTSLRAHRPKPSDTGELAQG